MTVQELVNLLTSDGIDPEWPILQGFQELNMQQPTNDQKKTYTLMNSPRAQMTINPPQLSSVKIDTDAKGNAKPSVHVYDENPQIARYQAVREYRAALEDLKPGPPPEPVNVPVSFLEGRLDLVKERLADNKQAGLWRDDDYQRGYVDGLAVAVAIMENRPLTFLQPEPVDASETLDAYAAYLFLTGKKNVMGEILDKMSLDDLQAFYDKLANLLSTTGKVIWAKTDQQYAEVDEEASRAGTVAQEGGE